MTVDCRPLDADLAGGPRPDPIERAIRDIAAGRPVVVVDDEDRENEGDLVFAASAATPELLAFTVRHTSGVVCVPMEGRDLDRLQLPPMTAVNQDRKGTAFAVSTDAAAGISTGISAADRARTIAVLADPASRPQDLVRPGHVFPLRAVEGGVLRRRGHTEAAVDLARLARLPPVGVICELVGTDGSMARMPALRRFCNEYDLALVTIADLVAYRRRRDTLVQRGPETALPTRHGRFRAVGYRSLADGGEHLALVLGNVDDDADVLVRVHTECLTGDALGSQRCDCGPQLDAALTLVAAEGRGVVLYLRAPEGRGLVDELHGLGLDTDTVPADLDLGAQMLADLGVRRVRLLSGDLATRAALTGHGLDVLG